MDAVAAKWRLNSDYGIYGFVLITITAKETTVAIGATETTEAITTIVT